MTTCASTARVAMKLVSNWFLLLPVAIFFVVLNLNFTRKSYVSSRDLSLAVAGNGSKVLVVYAYFENNDDAVQCDSMLSQPLPTSPFSLIYYPSIHLGLSARFFTVFTTL